MKRSFLFIMIALLGLVYYSTGRPAEISDRVLVTAVGVDETGDGCKLTLQVFTPEGSGGDTPLDPSKPNVKLVSGEGSTVSEAADDCRKKLSGDIFLGACRIILIGRDADLSRTDELFGWFLSSGDAFLNVDCASACPSAEKVLSLPVTSGGLASERFAGMLLSAENSGCCCECSFTELVSAMSEPSGAVLLPEFSAGKQDDSSGDAISEEPPLLLSQGALFRSGKYLRSVSPEEMGLISAVSGKGRYFTDGSGRLFRVRAREVTAITEKDSLTVSVRLTTAPAQPDSTSFTPDAEPSNALCARLSSEGCADVLNASHHLRRYAPMLLRSPSAGAPLPVSYRVIIG